MRRTLLALFALASVILLSGCPKAAEFPAREKVETKHTVVVEPPRPVLEVGGEPWCRAVLGAGLVGQAGTVLLPTVVSAGLLESAVQRSYRRLTTQEASGVLGAGLVGLGAADQPLLVVARLGTLDPAYRVVRTPAIRRSRHVVLHSHHHPFTHHATTTTFWHHRTTIARSSSRPTTSRSSTSTSRPTTSSTRTTTRTTTRSRR